LSKTLAEMALVTRFVRGLQRHDRIERAEVGRPGGLAKVARHERHPDREHAEMLGGISCMAGEKSSAT
jgi:hypothetical protein